MTHKEDYCFRYRSFASIELKSASERFLEDRYIDIDKIYSNSRDRDIDIYARLLRKLLTIAEVARVVKNSLCHIAWKTC